MPRPPKDPAKKTTARARPPKRKGRPSSYRPEYAKQAYHLCLLGATDVALADAFGVSDVTINNWKQAHPAFLRSLKAGKEEADAKVARSLFRRALGYSHQAVKIAVNTRTGDEYVVPYTERYPPDTTAAIFWLKNRRPSEWRDRQVVEHEGNPFVAGVTVVIDGQPSAVAALPPGSGA